MELEASRAGGRADPLRVLAAGLGLPDVLMCRGTYPLTPPLPFTPGQEVTGVITAVGEGVTRAVGEKVMGVTCFYLGHGSLAEECLAQEATVRPVPEGLTDAEAAGFWIPHITAWTGWSNGLGWPRARSWWCSVPPAAAASPPCSSDGPWGRTSWPW